MTDVRTTVNVMIMLETMIMIMIVDVIKRRIIALLILVIKLLIYYMELIKMFKSLKIMFVILKPSRKSKERI
jgi:hypothetical protein